MLQGGIIRDTTFPYVPYFILPWWGAYCENNSDFSVLKQNWLLFVCNYFIFTNQYVGFLFKWRDCKGRIVYINIHSSWPLICSFMFISTKSIVKLSPLWDKDTAQEMSNCISWNFISEVPPLLSCSFTHHKSFTTCFL